MCRLPYVLLTCWCSFGTTEIISARVKIFYKRCDEATTFIFCGNCPHYMFLCTNIFHESQGHTEYKSIFVFTNTCQETLTVSIVRQKHQYSPRKLTVTCYNPQSPFLGKTESRSQEMLGMESEGHAQLVTWPTYDVILWTLALAF